MAIVPQKELRNNVAEVLRRAEAGERITVTVSGRPVAELGPTSGRRFVSGADLERIWAADPPLTLSADLPRFGGDLSDPFAR